MWGMCSAHIHGAVQLFNSHDDKIKLGKCNIHCVQFVFHCRYIIKFSLEINLVVGVN